MAVTPQTLILLDFGCRDIRKIARAIRERSVYTMVMPAEVPLDRMMRENPVGIAVCSNFAVCPDASKIAKFKTCGIPMIQTAVPDDNPSAPVDALVKFAMTKCGCTGLWTLTNFIDNAVADIRAQVGDAHVILALSGGVDSSVAAALIHKAIGQQLTCVFVNHGLLRKNEPELVQQVFERTFGIKLCLIDASNRFLEKLRGVPDPERKRKIIEDEFIDVFSEAAEKIKAPFLAQGTIYPDILESIPLNGNPNTVIKRHRNATLPESMKFELLEPLKPLFKDEVRKVGHMLGLPTEVINRHPFPGPALGMRHLGSIERDTLNMLREADAIVTEEMRKSGWYSKTWQTFAVFLPVKAVGIRNGLRTCEHTIALRAVNTLDSASAEVAHLPWELLEKTTRRIIAEVPGVSRVVYDVTPKPPATIEWE